jgi:N-acyl-D-aspartate/D-glutamate deacylase
MLDLKIVGGTIVDGSGAPRFQGDVGVRDGRIVAVGTVAEAARETIDATGRIVAPGFIDVHTHYDAQVFWDPALSPSCYHGVTTIIGGFCGFSIAPITPEAAEYLLPMLARVEGMPLETLLAALPLNWRSFGEFLAAFEGRVGVNAGFFAGHSAIRRVVMGERAVGEKATAEDLALMEALLAQSLEQGALGFSTTISPTHNDASGNPVPSRWADFSEIVALGAVVRDFAGTGLELLPGLFDSDVRQLMTDLSVAGNRPVNWNALLVVDRQDMRRVHEAFDVSDYARERGGDILALTPATAPYVMMNLKTGTNLDANPGIWREVFRWPLAERMARLRDPAVRDEMRAAVAHVGDESLMKHFARFGTWRVESVEAGHNRRYVGRTVGEIAAEEHRDPLDVVLDIALDDELRSGFSVDFGDGGRDGYDLRSRLWRDDRTLIGASDAGAHLDQIDTFAYSTTVLEKGVREHGVITLEEAVYQMTDRPARYMGLIDRGLLRPGYHADIVVFDAAKVARGPTYYRHDVPADQSRIYADAEGIDHVFVNGVEIVRGATHTGALPGHVLRSGKDTRTVLPGALNEARPIELEPG